MLKLDLSLPEFSEESIAFEILDLEGSPVSTSPFTWDAYLVYPDDTTLPLKTEHGHFPHQILVTFPSTPACSVSWFLMRRSEDQAVRFLGGQLTIMAEPAVKQILAYPASASRSYAVRTQASQEAWQVLALPSSAAEFLKEDIAEIISNNIAIQRVYVSALPSPSAADPRAIYILPNNTAYVVVDGYWQLIESVYEVASPGRPGLATTQSVSSFGAPLALSVDGAHTIVPLASADTAGSVFASGDILSNSPSGLSIVNATSSKAGKAIVVGTDAENALPNSSPRSVWSADKTKQEIDSSFSELGNNKLNADFSNVADSCDAVVAFGPNFRRWKSGYQECWGTLLATTANANYTFVTPVKFDESLLDSLDVQTTFLLEGKNSYLNGYGFVTHVELTEDNYASITVYLYKGSKLYWRVSGFAA